MKYYHSQNVYFLSNSLLNIDFIQTAIDTEDKNKIYSFINFLCQISRILHRINEKQMIS